MKRALRVLFAVLFTLYTGTAGAMSISGIVIYGADDFGTPHGYATYDGQISAQLWRTAVGGDWHALGVWQGLPPNSLREQPLNVGNFMVEIPLQAGENVFTIAAEEGAQTRDFDYLRYTLNLYFDGNISGPPGISVLFPKFATPNGDPVSENRSTYIYNLALQQVDATPDMSYDDGLERATVTAVSFLPPERFNPDWDFDLLDRQRFAKSGKKDFLGVLKVTVEPSQSQDDGNLAPRAVAPSGGGVGGGGIGTTGGPGYGAGYGGYAPNQQYGGLPQQGANNPAAAGAYQQQAGRPTVHATQPPQRTPDAQSEPTTETTPGEDTPTVVATSAAGTPGAGTPTPDKTKSSTTPTAGKSGTPHATAAAGTPTPAAKTSAAATTPTPAAAKTPKP